MFIQKHDFLFLYFPLCFVYEVFFAIHQMFLFWFYREFLIQIRNHLRTQRIWIKSRTWVVTYILKLNILIIHWNQPLFFLPKMTFCGVIRENGSGVISNTT